MNNVSGRGKIIAVCGKGGVGKTFVSAAITSILVNKHRVLAVDADPASGLSSALGMRVRKTVDDIRNDFAQMIGDRIKGDKAEIAEYLDYEIFNALEEKDSLALLSIGRPEGEGCYCRVNSMLKDIIESVAKGFDYVVIDGEAGIEQVNRRIFSRVTHLLLVSDASARGTSVAQTIKKVADKSVRYDRSGLVLNRIRCREDVEKLSLPEDIPFLGLVPEDDIVCDAGIEGASILEMPDCPAMEGVKHIMMNFDCF